MSYAEAVGRTLDYDLCSYGASRLAFRGPRKRLRGDYIVVIGGGETFGRYVETPFPDRLEAALGTQVVNLGLANAGLDAFLKDDGILRVCAGSTLSVIQVSEAQNLSNRFYRVHPRRNDRFIGVTDRMRRVYPSVDFTEFHFTRHMLGALARESPRRFSLVRDEIRKMWVAKMNQLTNRIGTRVVLVWIGNRMPDDAGEWIEDGEPVFITRAMTDALRGRIVDMVMMPTPGTPSLDGKIFPEDEAAAALRLPGPDEHAELSDRLARTIRSRRLLA